MRLSQKLPAATVSRIKRMHGKIIRQEAQPMAAAHALTIVEVNDLIAVVAGKQPHRTSPINGHHAAEPATQCVAGNISTGRP